MWGSLTEVGSTANQYPLREGHLVPLACGWWNHRMDLSFPICKMGMMVPTLQKSFTTRQGSSCPGLTSRGV